MVYLPKHDSGWPALVIELKWDKSAEGAIDQILEKQYPGALKDYGSEIMSHFVKIGAMDNAIANKIAESLFALDWKRLQNAISEYMERSISYYDTGTEGFYHGLMLGLVALMDNQYKIRSNRESGEGRYDISLIPRDKKYPGIIMEFKSGKGLTEKALDDLSAEALNQIDDKDYDSELRAEGITEIMKLGIAFSGKKVHIATA